MQNVHLDAMTSPSYFSPRQLADALGVSESSVKRWVDRGEIEVERTAGGHRRLPWNGVMRFLRASDRGLTKPEVLGLLAVDLDQDSRAVLLEALAEGDADVLRAAIFRLYASGVPAAEICDRYLAAAFRDLGERWQHGDLEIYEERRAVSVCESLLHELNAVLPALHENAPRAAGGTLAGDAYTLPTRMIEVALREKGWSARSFGADLPVETLVRAVAEESLRLFWISVSAVGNLENLVASVNQLSEAADDRGITLVLGGRELDPDIRSRLRCSAFCDDLAQLADLADALEPEGDWRGL